MSKAALLCAPAVPAGCIRAYFENRATGETELVALNNLLAIVAFHSAGEFVLPQDFFDLCSQELWEKYGEEAWTQRRTDGSYRRILEHCTLWVADPPELQGRALFRAEGSERVLSFEIGAEHHLLAAEELDA